MVIQLFQHHRLSMSALVLATLAWCLCWAAERRAARVDRPDTVPTALLWRSAWWAVGGALCLGAAGLVLYDADWSAWAVVVAALAAARATDAAR